MKRILFLTMAAFLLCSSAAWAQEKMTVQVSVTDTNGDPLPGATVLEVGTRNSTTADVNGKTTISVPANATLEVSFMGYTPQQVSVTGTTMNVQLEESGVLLDEVVMVGYGSVKKTDLTGAVAALNAKKLNTVTSPRVEDMLNGKAPGVFVGSGSGQPGSEGAIIIRGKTTVNGSTAPLWVVDGVIIGDAAGYLNPADIESMTVLKDAASTAIYGSQGSNGVIVVTTKKGIAGQPVVSVTAKAGASFLNPGNMDMMDGSELYDLYNSFPNKTGGLFITDAWNEGLKKRNFNWWDQVSQTGMTQDYNVSIRGGTEKVKVYASLGYYDETGAIKGYDYSKYSGRVNVEYQMYDWLTIKPSASLSRRDTYSQQHSVTSIYYNLPWDSPYKPDGSIFKTGADADPIWIGNVAATNYLYDLQWNYTATRAYEFMGNFDFNIKITDWLSFESVNNYRMGTYDYTYYADPRSIGGESDKGSLRKYHTVYDRLYFNQLFRFNKTFNEVHHINGLVAYEWNEYNYDYMDATGASIPPGAEILSLAATPKTVAGSKSDWAVQSFFGNVNYAYENRYMFQGSLRRDGASNFGKNKQYGTFFSLSGAWNIHEEAFFEPVKAIVNSAKLRLSYGSTGNRPNSTYPSYTVYSLDKAYSYNGVTGALISGSAGNPDMTWETTYTLNGGLDVSLFDSRLNVSLDLYNKKTSGLLYRVLLPSVWGVSDVWRNVGEVDNKGIELTIGGDVIRTDDWRWNIEANLGSNKNKVVKLYGDIKEMNAAGELNLAGIATKILKPGYDMDTWYVPEWAGVNPTDGTPQWYTNKDGQRELTSVLAEAQNTTIGAYTPKFFGGFNTTLTWRFLDLNAVFSYSVGGKIFNYSRREYDSDGAYTDRNQMNLMDGWSRWEKPGDVATHPQARFGGNNDSNGVSSRYLEDGSYLKLKALTLGCNLPVRIPYVSGIRLYVSGENLLTFTGYSGVDPEVPIDADTRAVVGNVGPGVYPGVRKIMFGVNVTF